MTIQFSSRFFASTFQFPFNYGKRVPSQLLKPLVSKFVVVLFLKLAITLWSNSSDAFIIGVFDWGVREFAVHAPFCVVWLKLCPSTTPWEFPNKVNHACNKLLVTFSSVAEQSHAVRWVDASGSFWSFVWKHYGFLVNNEISIRKHYYAGWRSQPASKIR